MMLKIDLDSKNLADWDEFKKRFYELSCIWDLSYNSFEVYETNKGYHIYLDMSEHEVFKSNWACLTLQACLGSDYKREMFNLFRLETNKGKTEYWNVMFKIKYNKEKQEWISEKFDDLKTCELEEIYFKIKSAMEE